VKDFGCDENPALREKLQRARKLVFGQAPCVQALTPLRAKTPMANSTEASP
jgi:hypothetical protein